MIRVKKNNNSIKISGHALYNIEGKDIVCASVSSILYTTVNALLKIDKSSIEFSDDGKIIEIIKKSDDKIINLLLDNMIDLLKDLSLDYP